MPTYEYQCKTCTHEFELFQSITSKPRAKCPECGKSAQRLISSGAGFLFKGSGFYITDYRSQKYKQAAKKDKEKSSKSTSSSNTAPKKEKTSKKKQS